MKINSARSIKLDKGYLGWFFLKVGQTISFDVATTVRPVRNDDQLLIQWHIKR